MPFKKVGSKYKSPSGKTFTKKQVVAYYATDGFKTKPRTSTRKHK
jgi:hypothetical protein